MYLLESSIVIPKEISFFKKVLFYLEIIIFYQKRNPSEGVYIDIPSDQLREIFWKKIQHSRN